MRLHPTAAITSRIQFTFFGIVTSLLSQQIKRLRATVTDISFREIMSIDVQLSLQVMFSLETRFIAVDKYILLLVVNRSFSFVKSPEKYELSTYCATMNNFEHAGVVLFIRSGFTNLTTSNSGETMISLQAKF